jgi:hypothetical protein
LTASCGAPLGACEGQCECSGELTLLVSCVEAGGAVLTCAQSSGLTQNPAGIALGQCAYTFCLPACTPPDAGFVADGAVDAPSTDAGSDAAGDAACAAATTAVACDNCCYNDHVAGYDTFLQAALGCACSATGGCATVCAASACASPTVPPSPGDACDVCINQSLGYDDGGAACLPTVENACAASADCLALFGPSGCLTTSGCASKP